jgi:uncharacterized protein involved in response to NO
MAAFDRPITNRQGPPMAKRDHTPIPRYRASAGPAVFTQGFRPFFLLAGVWAVVALILSLAMMTGRLALPTAFDPIAWHAHELLFGFVTAAVAGYLLTTIPNWTGHLPLQGLPLAGLVCLWLAGRVAVAGSELIGAEPAAAVDLSFLLVLAATVLREIVAGRNWHNLPMILVVGLLFLCNMFSHAQAIGDADGDGLAQRLAIGVVVMLIALVGGRIIPSHTRNWLVKSRPGTLPAPPGAFDRACLIVTLIGLGCWIVAPGSALMPAFAGVAALFNFARLLRWRGHAASGEALV